MARTKLTPEEKEARAKEREAKKATDKLKIQEAKTAEKNETVFSCLFNDGTAKDVTVSHAKNATTEDMVYQLKKENNSPKNWLVSFTIKK